MAIKFDKLFEKFEEKGITTYRIRKDKLLGQATLQKLRSGTGIIDTRTIDRLCRLLDCQPGDIMSYEPDQGWHLVNVKTGEFTPMGKDAPKL